MQKIRMLFASVFAVVVVVVVVAKARSTPTMSMVNGIVVTKTTGQPVVNARVQYAPQSDGDRESLAQLDHQDVLVQTRVTDADGRFSFSPDASGIVTVAAPRFATLRRTWPPRQGRTLHFALESPVVVHGTVVDNRTLRPLAAAVTVLVQHPQNAVSKSAFVNDGRFQFDDLPSAPGVIVAYSDGYAPVVRPFTTVGGGTIDAHIRLSEGAKITGKVLDTYAVPVRNALLVATYQDTKDDAKILAGFIGGAMVTRSNGTFELRGIVPNTPITLYAAEYVYPQLVRLPIETYRTDSVTVEVGAGMVRDSVVLRLEPR